MAATATTRATDLNRWNTQDYLWLGLAVSLHALLLAIPALKHNDATTSTVPLNITLLSPRPDEEPIVAEPELQKNEAPGIDEEVVLPDRQPSPQLAHRKEPNELIDDEPPAKTTIMTTALLLDSAGRIEWPVPDIDDSRQLGVFVPQGELENWRSGIRIEDNLFNGMVLPRQTEIVDRWLAADGSHNVVINTPAGQTLCGRALPWDPMQPLVEHVMQFRPCGGGGKRTFRMSHRLERLTDNISLANSTTN